MWFHADRNSHHWAIQLNTNVSNLRLFLHQQSYWDRKFLRRKFRKCKIFYREGVGKRIVIFNTSSSWKEYLCLLNLKAKAGREMKWVWAKRGEWMSLEDGKAKQVVGERNIKGRENSHFYTWSFLKLNLCT